MPQPIMISKADLLGTAVQGAQTVASGAQAMNPTGAIDNITNFLNSINSFLNQPMVQQGIGRLIQRWVPKGVSAPPSLPPQLNGHAQQPEPQVDKAEQAYNMLLSGLNSMLAMGMGNMTLQQLQVELTNDKAKSVNMIRMAMG